MRAIRVLRILFTDRKRQNHPKSYSQSELSHLLGYKNGQFISNVERALCNVPLKMLRKVTEVLDISADELKHAILDDHERTLENYLSTNYSRSNVSSAMIEDDDEDHL